MSHHGGSSIKTVQQYFVGNMKEAIKHTLIFYRGEGDQPDIMIKSSNTETMSGPELIQRLMTIAHHYDPVDDVFSRDELERYVVRDSLGPDGKFFYLYHRHDERHPLMMVSETRTGGTPVVTVETHSGRIVQTMKLRNISVTVLRGLLVALVLFTRHNDLLGNRCANRWCYIVLRDGNHYVVVEKKVVVMHAVVPQMIVDAIGIGDNDMDANTMRMVHSQDDYASSYYPPHHVPPHHHHHHQQQYHHHHHHVPPHPAHGHVPPPPPSHHRSPARRPSPCFRRADAYAQSSPTRHAPLPPPMAAADAYPSQPFGALTRGVARLSLGHTAAAHYYHRARSEGHGSPAAADDDRGGNDAGTEEPLGTEPQNPGDWETFARKLLQLQARQQDGNDANGASGM